MSMDDMDIGQEGEVVEVTPTPLVVHIEAPIKLNLSASTGAMILFTNTGSGRIPRALLLSHQLYPKDILHWREVALAENPYGYKCEFEVFPITDGVEFVKVPEGDK